MLGLGTRGRLEDGYHDFAGSVATRSEGVDAVVVSQGKSADLNVVRPWGFGKEYGRVDKMRAKGRDDEGDGQDFKWIEHCKVISWPIFR
jgi:hypothetical protein